jgi:hypothetical protein
LVRVVTTKFALSDWKSDMPGNAAGAKNIFFRLMGDPT